MSIIDWFIIVVYMAGVIAAGLWFGRKERNTDDYFLGGRNIPWWAAMLSMVATEISAATFLGAPEQGLIRDATYLQFGIGSILARFALAFLFIGMFYKLRVVTVYGFLAQRFGFPTRNCAAGAFLLGRFLAGGSRLFIASLAVMVVTGLDMSISIVVLGIIAIGYTFFGGIKAVIWTDVIQAIVLIGAAFLSIALLLGDIPLSLGESIDYLASHDKFRLFDFQSTTEAGFPALFSNPYHIIPAIVGGFFLTMATHGTDQSMIQRLLTCKDDVRGRLSMVSSGFLGIGVTVVFLLVGMLLFVYAQHLPSDDPMFAVRQDMAAKGQNAHFYLYYIVNQIPTGISGIIIAAVLASAMSSIDSELNAMSATYLKDFHEPYFAPGLSEDKAMLVARYGTVVFGILLVVVAVVIADFYRNNPSTDLLSIALGVMTFFYGALLGIFLVGLLTRKRGSSTMNLTAMIFSTLLVILLNKKGDLLPALGLVDPNQLGHDFWSQLYSFPLAWPWNIVLGTVVTFAIAVIGTTTSSVLANYRGRD